MLSHQVVDAMEKIDDAALDFGLMARSWPVEAPGHTL
jgi:hypothetical protein